MEAFLERFYAEVDDDIGDPRTSVRLTRAQKLRDLHVTDSQVFDGLLGVTGQESLFNFAQSVVTLKNGESYYPLPANFRQLLGFEHRAPGDPSIIYNNLRSRSYYDPPPGLQILTAERGFRLDPAPRLGAPEDWTLFYLKGTCPLHYAKVAAVGTYTVTGTQPGDGAGELVLQEDFYNGSTIRLYAADWGAPQSGEIVDFNIVGGNPVFHVRHPWKPIGPNVWYEVCPCLPYPYDSLFAMEVAMVNLARRKHGEQMTSLLPFQKKMWNSAKIYAGSNVSDRGPTRSRPLKEEDLIPSGEVPYTGF